MRSLRRAFGSYFRLKPKKKKTTRDTRAPKNYLRHVLRSIGQEGAEAATTADATGRGGGPQNRPPCEHTVAVDTLQQQAGESGYPTDIRLSRFGFLTAKKNVFFL